MTGRTYKPRRAGKRWLEGAPPYIFDCFDTGPNGPADRFTVFFTDPERDPRWPVDSAGGWCLSYLGCSTGGRAVSMFGEINCSDAANYRCGHRRVRWLDIDPQTRAHIVARYQECEG